MEFHANCVSSGGSVGADYYQATFTLEEDSDELDSDSPYLLIQRSFEMSDGSCYVETHDELRAFFSAQNRVHASEVSN